MKKYMVSVGFVFISIMFFLLSTETISDEDRTITVLSSTKYRISLFYEKNKRCPKSLTELPIRIGYNNSFFDGSNNRIFYSVNKDVITLIGKVSSDESNSSTMKIVFKCRIGLR